MRNAEFDRETVLRNAMQAFQEKGYNKTSMQNLVAATGLHPGSLYCAFGNKRGILLAAVEQYRQDRAAQFATFFQNGTALEGLRAYLNSVVDECASCTPNRNCLVAKALNELAEQDPEIQAILTGIMTDLESSIGSAFAQAQSDGLQPGNLSAQQRARFFMLGVYGLRTYGHTHPGREVLQTLADQIFEVVSQ